MQCWPGSDESADLGFADPCGRPGATCASHWPGWRRATYLVWHGSRAPATGRSSRAPWTTLVRPQSSERLPVSMQFLVIGSHACCAESCPSPYVNNGRIGCIGLLVVELFARLGDSTRSLACFGRLHGNITARVFCPAVQHHLLDRSPACEVRGGGGRSRDAGGSAPASTACFSTSYAAHRGRIKVRRHAATAPCRRLGCGGRCDRL